MMNINGRNKFTRKTLLVIIVISLLSFLSLSNIKVQSSSSPPITTIIAPNYIKQELSTPSELESFLDSIIPNQLENYNISGATFSMVKDGSVFLEKGYGYANAYYETPVDANETLFRIGSVSKTFTSVAVLQLVEDGLLDLDIDVNEYLSAFKIPETFEESITLRHLLTHCAGFEESTFPVILGSYSYLEDFETILSEGIPDRVRPPNTTSAYSNYGFALAGYIVQEISGSNFESYIQDEILTPLGMNSTTFQQPLPSTLSSHMSTGYDENMNPGYFEYISIPPAGSASSTASDMAKFMQTLLNKGSLGLNRILENDTVEMMLSTQFITYENLPGLGLGIYEFDLSDQRIIGHGGDTVFFHSRMILLPELDIGIFASYNSRGGSIARTLLFSELIEEYFPPTIGNIEPMNGYKNRAKKFEGFYVTTRRVYSDKLMFSEKDFIDESFTINAKKGHLIIEGISLEFVEVEPNYFVESTGEYYLKIAFIEDYKGRISHLYTNFVGPVIALERTHPLYYGSEIQTGMVAAFLLIMFVSLAYWGIKGIIDVYKKREKKARIQRFAKWSYLLNFSLAAIISIFTALKVNSDIMLEYEIVRVFNGFLILPFLYLLATINTIVFTWFAWTGIKDDMRKPYWTLSGRIHYSILALLSIVLIGIFNSWHLFIF
ncbi:MAG: beta-lactamase family protein [Candidatus Heimdallarchaeota archaeon]|nr:beta-lactamase family protein [Candidatus Heimdallarchaeota archaeon]